VSACRPFDAEQIGTTPGERGGVIAIGTEDAYSADPTQRQHA
jgi:hypothetical protein